MAWEYDPPKGPPRRKCFISYHHADDDAVARFVDTFDHTHNVFIRRRLGENPEDLIDSTNPDYVMQKIRERFLSDSTVTIVIMGRCTWARRYVDWEIQSSLRQGASLPNGLLGIKLPTFGGFPERFNANLSNDWPRVDCYARHMDYPTSLSDLQTQIEAAFQRRTSHANYIRNSRDRMIYNRTCQ
jgi:hypothetical protein